MLWHQVDVIILEGCPGQNAKKIVKWTNLFYLVDISIQSEYLYAHARRIREDVEFLYPHSYRLHAGFGEAQTGQTFRQRLYQIDVPRHGEMPDLHDQIFVAQHIRQPVIDRLRRFKDRQIQIDPHPLRTVPLVAVYADQTVENQVVDKDLPCRSGRCGRRMGWNWIYRHLVRSLFGDRGGVGVGEIPPQMLAPVEGDQLPGHGGGRQYIADAVRNFRYRRPAAKGHA